MSNREYHRTLNKLLDDMFKFAKIHDLTWNDMANLSGVCHITVVKLGIRQTKFPLFRTVVKLAKGIGFNISIPGMPVRKVKV